MELIEPTCERPTGPIVAAAHGASNWDGTRAKRRAVSHKGMMAAFAKHSRTVEPHTAFDFGELVRAAAAKYTARNGADSLPAHLPAS